MCCLRLRQTLGLLGLVLLAATGPAASPQAGQSPTPSVVQPSLREVLRGVENRYNRLKSMKAQFQQTFRQGGRSVRREQGTLYLSKPGRMRWEYESPESKLFLTDGKRVILFVPSENRVMESPVKETEDVRAPLAFLLGRLNFDEQFQRMETGPQLVPAEKGNFVFKAHSKQLAERLEWVLFEVSPVTYEIRRVIARERGGLENEFRFDAVENNPALAASLFQFTAPAGAQVVRE
jgi:outer membrane lipoprotein carrier protein